MTASMFVLGRTKKISRWKDTGTPRQKLSSLLQNFSCSNIFATIEHHFDALWNWDIN